MLVQHLMHLHFLLKNIQTMMHMILLLPEAETVTADIVGISRAMQTETALLHIVELQTITQDYIFGIIH